LAPLKENLKYHLKKHHMGKANAVTIRDLAGELFIIRATTQEIRRALMELLLEGFPIVMFPELKVYFAGSQEEIDEWWETPAGGLCF
jgi:hypothetical protein